MKNEYTGRESNPDEIARLQREAVIKRSAQDFDEWPGFYVEEASKPGNPWGPYRTLAEARAAMASLQGDWPASTYAIIESCAP